MDSGDGGPLALEAQAMRLIAAAVTVVLASACGPTELKVSMKSDNNSGQVGFATIEDLGDKIRVTIETTVPVTGASPQLAHIHEGNCGEIGIIRAGLSLLEKTGEKTFGSTTEVGMTFKVLKEGDFNINAHDSSDISIYVSCGEIPKP